MSYSTWHNYGYGIRVDDIKEQSVERLQALLKLAPELDQKIRAWLSELDIAEPDWDDYMDFDQVYGPASSCGRSSLWEYPQRRRSGCRWQNQRR